MIDYLRNLFVSWFNKLINWFSNRHKKKDLPNNNVLVPVDKNKHADEERQKNISEGFQALDEGCKSIANLRAEIEMSQTNNDLDAPVPANNNGTNVPSLCYAPDSHGYCRVAKKEGNNLKNNLEENNMGLLQSKVIKSLGGTPAPKSEKECDQQIEELKKKKLEFQNKEGVTPIKPVGQEKVLPSNISPISMRSNNDNSNWMDPNDLNNTFEYQDEKVQKAMKGANNKMGELINKKAEEIKQDVKKEIKNQLAESKIQEQLNDHEEKINKNTEDIKKNTEDIKKMQEEQIDIKKMLAKHDEMIADNKRRLDKAEKMLEDMKEERKDTKRMLEDMKQQTADIHKQTEKMDEKWREHDAKWMEMFGLYLKKKPRSSRNGNRESTNTSFSSFRGYGYMNMNNSQIPKMERADMAHSYDDNE